MSHKVFVLEPVKYDLSSVGEYGDIHYLYEANEPRSSVWTSAFVNDCFSRLKNFDFNCDRDFILVSGAQVPLTLLVAHLVASFETVNLLLFDAKHNEYVHKSII